MHQANAIRCFLILTDAEVGLLWLGLIRRSNNWKHLAWFPKESSLARQRLWQGPDIDNNKKRAGRPAGLLTGSPARQPQSDSSATEWRRWGAGVVTGIFCGDLQFFAACFHARNRGLCLITMTGAVPLLGNRTEGRTTVERHSPKLLLSSIIIAISLHHLSGRRHLISRCTVLGMSKKYHNEL